MRKLASFMGLMLLILTTSIFTSCKEPKPEPKVYTVTFDAAGGSEVAAIQVKSGEKAVQPEEPTKEGYVFDAWYNGDVEYDWETPVTANLTLTAKWTDKTYTVTFDVEGIEAQEVKHKDKVTKPAEDPTKEGFVFAGWLNGETAYDFEIPVTSDLALTAKWDVVKYSITFDVEGVKAIEVEHGKVAEEPAAPTKDGYTFKGWMNGDAAYDWTKAVTANVELKASWEATKYTITYLPEGIETDNPKEYTIESEEITLKAPTKAPVAAKPNFVQWRAEKEDGDVVTKIEKGSIGNKTFYAEYTDKTTYKVAFMEGDKAVGEVLTVTEGEKVKLPTDYAKYDLYSDKECKTAFDATTAITADTTIYVKVKTFTVKFDSDGGSEVKAITVNYGEVAKKPDDPKKEGDVKFNGWYNGDKAYDWTTKVTSNLTLKAQWKALGTYTVTFDVAGIAEQKVKEGQKATKPETDPTKEGYTFKGWMNGDVAYDWTAEVKSNLTLTASWKINEYTVTFDSDDGSEVAAAKVKYNETAEEPTAPTKEGFDFVGWYEGETKFDFATKITKDISLKAKWEEKKATEPEVTYDEVTVDGNTTTILRPTMETAWGTTVKGNVISFSGNSAAKWTYENIKEYSIVELFYETTKTENAKLSIKSSDGKESHSDLGYPDLSASGSLKYNIADFVTKNSNFSHIVLANNANNNDWSNNGANIKWDDDWSVTITKIVLTKVEKLEDKVIFDPASFTAPEGMEIVEKDGVKYLKVTPNGYNTSINLAAPVDISGYTHYTYDFYNDEAAEDWQVVIALKNYSEGVTGDDQSVGNGTDVSSTEVKTVTSAIIKDSTVTALQPFAQSKTDWNALTDKVVYFGKITAITK